MRRQKIKGYERWCSLIGEYISFQWSDGYDPFQTIEGFLEDVQFAVGDDPRYPRVYVWFEDQGGYGVYDGEEVVVTFKRPGLRSGRE